MANRRRNPPREKDLTSRFLDGDVETDRLESQQRFTQRSKNAQQNKMEQTALLRAAEQEQSADIESLPIGQVMQVYSLYCEVDHPSGQRLCVVRKTLSRLAGASMVVGDFVRFRDTPVRDEIGPAGGGHRAGVAEKDGAHPCRQLSGAFVSIRSWPTPSRC